MPSSVLKGTCASLSLRGLHSLVFNCNHSCTCASECFELNVALISPCSQWSFVVHMRMDPSCLRCSTFLHSSMVSVSPPAPLFPQNIYYNYQCDGCPPSLLGGGSWLGCQDLPAMGAVSSRSWLPIVEAPGCPGLLTSIEQCCC